MEYKGFIITIGVSDIESSIQFYMNALQLKRVQYESDDIAFFDLGGSQLALYPRAELAKDACTSPDGEGFSGVTLALNVESSGEVTEVLGKAVAAGGTLVKPGQAVFWGGFSGYFSDPDGHLWEIACGADDYKRELSSS